MKKQIMNTIMLLALTTGMMANTNNNTEITKLEIGSCTVSYTNSKGIKFSATAATCGEAYEMIAPHVEATRDVPLPTLTEGDLGATTPSTFIPFPLGTN
ncbi:hypothetical protein [Aquimarina algiphila]|uniref:hypothetical protein n=1 Tax=Aquimarina algiphila TaxID=2047982 RepID=UPI00232DBD28|nr:hypothetical protein [Aquimarina algiphila]